MKKSVRHVLPFLALAVVVGCGRNAAKEAGTPAEPPRAEKEAPAPAPAPAEPAPAPEVKAEKAEEPAPPVTVEEKAPQAKRQASVKPKGSREQRREERARVSEPVRIADTKPQYPELAKRHRIEGIVTLKAKVKADGTVTDVKVVNGVHPLLDGAAERCVKMWKYRPAMVDGHAVPAGVKVTVGFKL